MERRHKKLTIVTNGNNADCLYINGVAWESIGEYTVYGWDIAEASDGNPVRVEHQSVEFVHEKWPKKLEDALARPVRS